MIIQETIILDGKEYLYTYSSLGYQIAREGNLYYDAIDPIGSKREYKETAIKINEDNFTIFQL